MSQVIAFYKLTLLSERVAELSRENIYEALKGLFKGSDRIASDMVSEYFEAVNLDLLEIGYERFLKEDEKFEKRVKRIFARESSSFFFVDEKDWAVIQKLTEDYAKDSLNSNQIGIAERLNKTSMVFSDYGTLKNLYEKKILLAEFI